MTEFVNLQRWALVKHSDQSGPAPVGTEFELLFPKGWAIEDMREEGWRRFRHHNPAENPMCWTEARR